MSVDTTRLRALCDLALAQGPTACVALTHAAALELRAVLDALAEARRERDEADHELAAAHGAMADMIDRRTTAEARAERLAAVLEAEREERRAERAVQEAEYAIGWAEARDDDAAYERATRQHTAATHAYCLAHQRAEAARASLAAERGEAGEGGAHGRE